MNLNKRSNIRSQSRYNSGYSLGVGGVVVNTERILLIRRASGVRQGSWAIPGGYVESGETIDDAVRREIREETGIVATVDGLIGVRNRIIEADNENSAYFIFLLRSQDDRLTIDKEEVSAARFVNRNELQEIENLLPLSYRMADKVLSGDINVLPYNVLPGYPQSEYIVYH